MQAGRLLNNVLEHLPALRQILPSVDGKEVNKIVQEARRKGVVFALPHNGELQDRQSSDVIKGDILRPPYPVCVLEYSASHPPEVPKERRSSWRIVVAIDHETHVMLYTLSYSDTRKMWEPNMVAIDIDYDAPFVARVESGGLTTLMRTIPLLPIIYQEGSKRLGGEAALAKVLQQESIDELWAYTDFCRTLHSHEVTFVDVEPDAKTNFDRKLRGEVPLFTYKTLTIGGPKKEGHGNGGGTHASPRSHMRRGHYRTLKSGKRIWINSFMVIGNGEGFVHKDYKVVGAEA